MISDSGDEAGEIKGYYYNSKLEQLERLLTKQNYTELNIKINKLSNDKNIALRQLLCKRELVRALNDKEIIDFGGNLYALDEIIQRLIEALQLLVRQVDRLKTER